MLAKKNKKKMQCSHVFVFSLPLWTTFLIKKSLINYSRAYAKRKCFCFIDFLMSFTFANLLEIKPGFAMIYFDGNLWKRGNIIYLSGYKQKCDTYIACLRMCVCVFLLKYKKLQNMRPFQYLQFFFIYIFVHFRSIL